MHSYFRLIGFSSAGLTVASLLSISGPAFSTAVFWMKQQANSQLSWAIRAAASSIISLCCGVGAWENKQFKLKKFECCRLLDKKERNGKGVCLGKLSFFHLLWFTNCWCLSSCSSSYPESSRKTVLQVGGDAHEQRLAAGDHGHASGQVSHHMMGSDSHAGLLWIQGKVLPDDLLTGCHSNFNRAINHRMH